jgi:hypothetical protein
LNGSLTDVHWLLTDLCTKGGYCAAARQPERFVHLVAGGPEQFADAVLVAEGFDLLTMDKRQRRGVISMVTERFELWVERERASRSTNSPHEQDD